MFILYVVAFKLTTEADHRIVLGMDHENGWVIKF